MPCIDYFTHVHTPPVLYQAYCLYRQLACRKEHLSAQTLDKLSDLSPARAKTVLSNLQKRDWRGVKDVADAVWITLKHAK